MRIKRIMIVGASGSGKTSLSNYINDIEDIPKKCQDIIYKTKTIDVPASFIEVPWLHKHLIALSQDALCVLMLVDQSNYKEFYSPNFAKVFLCPVIGVISKNDLNIENENKCCKQLKNIGINEPYFKISIKNMEQMENLKKHLYSL